MKTFFPLVLFGSLIVSVVSAQNNSTQKGQQVAPFNIEKVALPGNQHGSTNFLLSGSEQDFKNKSYVFCTDSNATVAYLNINGFTYRLTGGANPEHIWTYSCKAYTVTLDLSKTNSNKILDNADDRIMVEVEATLAVYNSAGQVVGKKVTGEQINEIKN